MHGATDSRLRLPAVLDLAASETLLDTMRHACEAESLKVDASGVDVLTLPCMQIVLAALRVNPGMTIENPSEAFVRSFADLALEWRQDGQRDAQHEAEQDAQQVSQQAGHDAAANDTDVTPDTQTDEACMTKRILTIDDSRTIRDMLNLTLSEAGFEVLQAVDGQDGIDVLEKEQVDLVITDINMPKMDGYGVIRHIRGQSRYNGMPVLVLTTESETDKRNVAREAGATGWMVKPFDPERLIATINKVAP
jgi:two-component system chemotaxis response regulator CheY